MIDELFGETWCRAVADNVIDFLPTMTPRQSLRSKTPESSRLAFQVLAYNKKLGRMVRV